MQLTYIIVSYNSSLWSCRGLLLFIPSRNWNVVSSNTCTAWRIVHFGRANFQVVTENLGNIAIVPGNSQLTLHNYSGSVLCYQL